jgi:hypothetical protein
MGRTACEPRNHLVDRRVAVVEDHHSGKIEHVQPLELFDEEALQARGVADPIEDAVYDPENGEGVA